MNIPMFKQDLKQFLSSKTNWTGMTMIVTGVVGLIYKSIDPVTAWKSISGGVALICVKDAIAKK